MDREIEERQLFYNRQMDINLKKNMITYARQFGKDVLENYQSHVLKNAKPKVWPFWDFIKLRIKS